VANVSKTRIRPIIYYTQLLASLLGVITSIFLVVQHTRLKTGIQASASFCSLGRFSDCDVVNASRFSEIFGVPVATLGASFYFLILILSLLGSPSTTEFRKSQRLISYLSAVALLVDLGLFSLSIFVLHNLCILCFLTYLTTLVVLASTVWMVDRPGVAFTQRARLAFFADENEVPAPWHLARVVLGGVCYLSFAVAVFFLPSWIRMNSNNYSYVDTAIEQFYQTWKDKKNRNIEVKDTDGTFGNPNAKVKVVEFSDFECPHCRKAAFTMHTALKAFGDRIYFVFKNYPLDSACNPGVPYQLHPNACMFARLAYCASKKNEFWAYHDTIFFTWGEEKRAGDFETIADTLRGIFTRDEITKCMQDEKSLQNVSEDIKLGNSFDVKGTPAIFINGKAVTIPLTVETLGRLVAIEESLK
jgi:protein-disulfide isomerase/uncharacterized membrane protein